MVNNNNNNNKNDSDNSNNKNSLLQYVKIQIIPRKHLKDASGINQGFNIQLVN